MAITHQASLPNLLAVVVVTVSLQRALLELVVVMRWHLASEALLPMRELEMR